MIAFRAKHKPQPKVCCVDIVNAYGEVLERTPYGLGMSMPASVLPYDICLIKEALASVFLLSEDASQQAMLKAGFFELASFVEEDVRPNAYLEQAKPPSTGPELNTYFATYGQDVRDAAEISRRIAAKREVLAAEWNIRLEICKFAVIERIAE